MKIIPITLSTANKFVEENHRHHSSVVGCKFAIGLNDGEELIGVAICGRPVSRYLDDGETLEINRLCTTGTRNACSMLYGACCRVAKAMGYQKVITYILQSEDGASLRASNFTLEDDDCGGVNWTGKRKRTSDKCPQEKKKRYARVLSRQGLS